MEPIFSSPDQRVNEVFLPHAQSGSSLIEHHSIHFTASGSEYFRIWIVNLLLIIVTLGFYQPWAKVRKLKYFYNNTVMDGHALDFHGNPKRMLMGLLLSTALFGSYSLAQQFSGYVTLLVLLVIVALAPNLFQMAMRFRLANTSWRGMRFRFTASRQDAYRALLPSFLLIAICVGASTVAAMALRGKAPLEVFAVAQNWASLVGLGYVLLLALIPYFLWKMRSFQHAHYAFGQLQSEFRAGAASFYALFFKTIGVSVLIVILVATLIAFFGGALSFASWGFGSNKSWMSLVLLPVAVILLIANLLPRAFFTTRMQNLVWSRTGNNAFRLRSDLKLKPFAKLQIKNYFFILLTLGIYWPFAVIATRRAQLEAITVHSLVDMDTLVSAAGHDQAAALGDATVDLFGLDIGF